ncbi:sugar kinase [bacterium]|nr:MAG: sugar kinase [bacterium]
MPEVICVGILVADVIGRPIEKVPLAGELALVESITPHVGGCAANTGIGLRRLGVDTAVVGAVGRDGFGDFVRQALRDEGMDVSGIKVKEEPTSSTMVLVRADGERTFLHCVGANAALHYADFDASTLEAVRVLHIAGHGLMPAFDGRPCADLLAEAQKRGVLTSLDTAGSPDALWRERLMETLPFLDFFVPSLHEVRQLFPDCETPESIVGRLLDEGVGTVALKMGEAGSYARNQSGEIAWAAALPVTAVDATGAGDAFAAGFLASTLRGLSLEMCLKMGNATGACCVSAVGTVTGLRDWDSTFALLEEKS